MELHLAVIDEISNSSARACIILDVEPVSRVSVFSAAVEIEPRQKRWAQSHKAAFLYFIGRWAGWWHPLLLRIFLKWDPEFPPGLGESIPNSRPTRDRLCASRCCFHPAFCFPGAFLQSLKLNCFFSPQNVAFRQIALGSEGKVY